MNFTNSIAIVILLNFVYIICTFLPQNKQANQIYKDDKYNYEFSIPQNYTFSKVAENMLCLREKRDIESNVRIRLSIEKFETYTSKGGVYNFSEFVRNKSKNLYEELTKGKTDSLIIKDYLNSNSLSGKEIYVSLRFNDEDKNNESQIIRGPIFIFDISAKINVPGTALIIFQPTDDSRTTKVFRNIAEEIKFN